MIVADRVRTSPGAAVYIFLLALIPLTIFFIPLDLAARGGITAAFVLGLALVFAAVLFLFRRGSYIIPRSALVLSGVPLALIGCVSAYGGVAPRTALLGVGFEVGTVGSLVLFAASIAAGALVSTRLIGTFYRAFIGITALAGFYTLVALFSQSTFPGEGSVRGEWPHLSFLLASALLIASVLGDKAAGRWSRSFYFLSTLVLSMELLVLFHPAAAALLATIAFLTASFLWANHPQGTMLPLHTGLVALLFFIVLFFGMRSPSLELPPDVRPSLLATELVAGPAYASNLYHALLGTGPNTFPNVWEKYRPIELNGTPFWDKTPKFGYSTAATFLITLGLLGIFALFLIPLTIIAQTIGLASHKSQLFFAFRDTPASVASGALMLFSFGAMVVYTSSAILFLVGGVAVGFLVRLTTTDDIVFSAHRSLFARAVVAFALLVFGGELMWISSQQFLASARYDSGIALLNAGAFARAAPLLERAARQWPISSYERDASRAILASVFTATNAKSSGGSVDINKLRQEIDKATTLANLAVDNDSGDFMSWLSRAELYISLIARGYPNAEDLARVSLEQAAMLAPARPDIPYLQAVLSRSQGHLESARGKLEEALRLKPDYAEASQLIEVLSSAQ